MLKKLISLPSSVEDRRNSIKATIQKFTNSEDQKILANELQSLLRQSDQTIN